ncbi:iron ABC transporter ATP-binding protein [Diaminobutyricimonas sp. LJ205]|uniref:iron ABC transporter ATP-binding protein n=1 Tax=Diaminobutyricimonas sp. LJ205 TaxID=2683590 RepID=UPI0012F4C588|nr:iron ABC transporter ATP-binding protein [Diaminobutyricimonas sp. LJ205]
MPSSVTRSAARVSAAMLGLVLAATLAGCSAESAEPAATPTGSAAPTSVATAPAGETATPEPSATPVGTPVTIGCDALLTPQALYDYNPNFGTDPSYSPAKNSLAAQIVDYKGVACGWVNQTSSEPIEIAVADLPEEELTRVKNDAFAISNMVPTYGDEAYFRVTDGVGEARVFSGTHWVVVMSPAFYEPGDAVPIIEPVLAALAG